MDLIDTRINITTDSSGDDDATADTYVKGYLELIEWVDGTLADGVDAVISLTDRPSGVDKTLLTLTDANDDADYPLRVQGVGADGAAIDGVYDLPFIVGVPRVVVSDGGNVASGAVVLYWWKP